MYFLQIYDIYLFEFYNSSRYSRMLEEGSFRGRTADYFWLLMFGVVSFIVSGHKRKKYKYNNFI